MSQGKILVVEDDEAIRQGICDALEMEGYTVYEAADGETGKRSALSADVDMILLDLILPKIGGLEILKEVRETRPTMPVIILTAMGDESDRVAGLKLGADDYVVKPFSVSELIARIEAVRRRSAERPKDVQQIFFEGGQIDFERNELKFDDGKRLELSEKELDLLRYLAMNANRAISREEIFQKVWHISSGSVNTRTIDMHIARLRDKLKDNENQNILMTVRGKGYMFKSVNS
jgi:two-component system alkaline phosphatase synthesis response regulator PhoP